MYVSLRRVVIVCVCVSRNVMSSQDVVDFVKQRLLSGVTKLSAICEEVSKILSLVMTQARNQPSDKGG